MKIEQTSSAPPGLDVVATCVLYRTPVAEVRRLIGQLGNSGLSLQLVLVDNSPEPIDLGPVEPWVTVLWPGRNLGYGRGNSLALRYTAGWSRYVLILNSDLVFDGADLKRLMAYLDAYPDVVAVAPQVRYPDGSLQTLCRMLPTPADLIGRQFLSQTNWSRSRDRRYEFQDWSYDHPAQFPFLSGCFLLARRGALDEIGGFDPRYFLYGEDLDLSRRLHQLGRTMFVPAMTILHDYRSRNGFKLRLMVHKIVNLARYFNKWGWFFDHERQQINARARSDLLKYKNEQY